MGQHRERCRFAGSTESHSGSCRSARTFARADNAFIIKRKR
jgi:hypothetical protein